MLNRTRWGLIFFIQKEAIINITGNDMRWVYEASIKIYL